MNVIAFPTPLTTFRALPPPPPRCPGLLRFAGDLVGFEAATSEEAEAEEAEAEEAEASDTDEAEATSDKEEAEGEEEVEACGATPLPIAPVFPCVEESAAKNSASIGPCILSSGPTASSQVPRMSFALS